MNKIYKILAIVFAVLMLPIIPSCKSKQSVALDYSKYPAPVAGSTHPVVCIDIKNYGQIYIELYPEQAPECVNNLVYLANTLNYLDGAYFYKAQEGGLVHFSKSGDSTIVDLDYGITQEWAVAGFTQNTLDYTEGTLLMMRNPTGDGTDMMTFAGQFFILDGSWESHKGEYPAFGRVIQGIEIVHKIAKLQRYMNSDGTKNLNTNTAGKEDTAYMPQIVAVRVHTQGITYQEPKKYTYSGGEWTGDPNVDYPMFATE